MLKTISKIKVIGIAIAMAILVAICCGMFISNNANANNKSVVNETREIFLDFSMDSYDDRSTDPGNFKKGDNFYIEGMHWHEQLLFKIMQGEKIIETATIIRPEAGDPTYTSKALDIEGHYDILFDAKAETLTILFPTAPEKKHKVSVSLDGGTITSSEKNSIEKSGWSSAKGSSELYTKEFDDGMQYSSIMSEWNSISPIKNGNKFDCWTPEPNSEKLTKDITFTAKYQNVESQSEVPNSSATTLAKTNDNTFAVIALISIVTIACGITLIKRRVY